MKMEWMQIQQVRNLGDLQLLPGPAINLITGPNASGKTSILEAIFLLARARSFRTPRIQDVIQHQKKSLLVSARIMGDKNEKIFTGIEKEYGKTTIRYQGDKIKVTSEQARNIPLVIVTQDSHNLVTAGAKTRRHWLDWAMFHVEPNYLEKWKHYMKALRQRNALLKNQERRRDLYRGWEEAMVESGSYLTAARESFITQMSDRLLQITANMFPESVAMRLTRGWPEMKSYGETLEDSWHSDMRSSYTRAGPHQADIKITNKNKEIASFYSRGQIKLFVCFMMMAQSRVFIERTGIKPLVLVDDVTAELDSFASERLLNFLMDEGVQAVLTTTETVKLPGSAPNCQVFHVEQGRIL